MASASASAVHGVATPARAASRVHPLPDHLHVAVLPEEVEGTHRPKRSEREIFSSTASPWWISPSTIMAPRLSLWYSGTRWRRLEVT